MLLIKVTGVYTLDHTSHGTEMASMACLDMLDLSIFVVTTKFVITCYVLVVYYFYYGMTACDVYRHTFYICALLL